LKDIRIFIFNENNNLNKPEKVLRLTKDFKINEIRKADA
jgi:hypothetical protein